MFIAYAHLRLEGSELSVLEESTSGARMARALAVHDLVREARFLLMMKYLMSTPAQWNQA